MSVCRGRPKRTGTGASFDHCREPEDGPSSHGRPEWRGGGQFRWDRTADGAMMLGRRGWHREPAGGIVSPILMRPVREQLEHDRVVQALLGRFRRRYDVAVNVGADESTTVRAAGTTVCPDLVLSSPQGGRRLEGIVEVETGESVNHLEAMAQWANMGRVRAPFYLYVPAGAVDVARRLCDAHDVSVSEIWSFQAIGDTLRFTMAHKAVARPRARPSGAAATKSKKTAGKKTVATKKSSPGRTAVVAKRATKAGSTRKSVTKATAKKKSARPVKHK